jgi:hypothetical protein
MRLLIASALTHWYDQILRSFRLHHAYKLTSCVAQIATRLAARLTQEFNLTTPISVFMFIREPTLNGVTKVRVATLCTIARRDPALLCIDRW